MKFLLHYNSAFKEISPGQDAKEMNKSDKLASSASENPSCGPKGLIQKVKSQASWKVGAFTMNMSTWKACWTIHVFFSKIKPSQQSNGIFLQNLLDSCKAVYKISVSPSVEKPGILLDKSLTSAGMSLLLCCKLLHLENSAPF